MATRTALLNGNVINRDTDFSKYIEAISEPGVISGFAVSSSSVAVGQALVKCERTNGDTIYAVVYNNSSQEISGNGDVFIEIAQELIDNGELANEDGSEIAEIKVGTMPSKNALKLATITGGVVEDERVFIKKVDDIRPLEVRMGVAEVKIDKIIEDTTMDHLEETGRIGETYTLSDCLFKHYTPSFINSTLDLNVGDVSDNKKIQIQRISSGTASNKLKLKVKSVGSPTTGLTVEIRKGVVVTDNSEVYWHGGELVCSGSINYSVITSNYSEIEVVMDGQFGGLNGELLNVVVYQTGTIVNASNYYVIGCDSTQYSEGYGYVSENGNSEYTKFKLMPFCLSDGLLGAFFGRYKKDSLPIGSVSGVSLGGGSGTGKVNGVVKTYRYDSSIYTGTLNITITGYTGYTRQTFFVNKNGTRVYTGGGSDIWQYSFSTTFSQGDIIEIGLVVDLSQSTWGYNLVIDSGTTGIPGDRNGAVLKVSKIGELGELISGTSFGEFTDTSGTSFYLGDDTITSVDTGNITLGNAIGFVQIGKYKIPYYL